MAHQKCVVDKCTNTEAADCRGLCLKCYSIAKKMVASGKTTWEQLEENGMAKPKDSPFLSQFDKLSGGK